MKVLFINHSDSRGGASVVTMRLLKALVAQGVDARMLVVHASTDNPRVEVVGSKPRRRMAFLAECGEIFTQNGLNRRDLFKVSTGSFGVSVVNHPWVKDADVVVLAWINQGMLSLGEIRHLCAAKPVVWTMHDMWNPVGACHHAGECERWRDGSECGGCPLVGGHGLARRVFRRKKRLYAQTDINFVAVSNWLADRCRQSPLMASSRLMVIPNAFPVEEFTPHAAKSLPASLSALPSTKLIVMGAARLDDPIKDIDLAIDSLNRLNAKGVTAVFYGSLKDEHCLDRLKFPHVWLGPIETSAVAPLMSRATVVLSTSRYETLPGTVIEGMAAGATPVTTPNGGQRDIIDHGVNGYIADIASPENIAHLIEKALDKPFDREAQHQTVLHKFSADSVARRYVELFTSLIGD